MPLGAYTSGVRYFGTAALRKRHHDTLRTALEKPGPLLVSRIGSGEIRICAQPRANDEKTRRMACNNVGVSPPSVQQLAAFATSYAAATRASDVMGVWSAEWFAGEGKFLKRYCNPRAQRIHAECIGDVAYCMRNPNVGWWSALRGKRVVVIHPFAQSIERQYARIAEVFPKWENYPHFTLITIRAPMTQRTLEQCRALKTTWTAEKQRVVEKLRALDFDVALLGCGGYAMPIGHAIRSMGKKAVVMGGALQLFFGIIGRRWLENRYYRHIPPLVNDKWVRPAPTERPPNWKFIEQGAYW